MTGAMTNPEVEGLVDRVAQQICETLWPNLADAPQVVDELSERIAPILRAALTHPLPDGEGGEREKIVYWLRAYARSTDNIPEDDEWEAAVWREIALRIERGDHLTTSEPRA